MSEIYDDLPSDEPGEGSALQHNPTSLLPTGAVPLPSEEAKKPDWWRDECKDMADCIGRLLATLARRTELLRRFLRPDCKCLQCSEIDAELARGDV